MDFLLIANICEDPNILKAIRLIMDILWLATKILPVALIVLSIIDIAKAVISADPKSLMAKFGVALKRLVLAVLIFFTPAFVGAISTIVEDGAANITHSYNSCISNTNNIEYYEKLEKQKQEEEKQALSKKTEEFEGKLKEMTEESLKEARERQAKFITTTQIQTGPVTTTSSSIPSNILNASSKEKLNYLFPGGTPRTSLAMQPYLISTPVAMTKKDGTKYTGKLLVHKALAKDIQDVFQIAQNSGFKIYQAGAFSFRSMNNGSSGNLSHHSYGVAIDINVDENYSHRGGKVYAGKFWDPSRSEYSIPKNGVLVQAFKSKGWKWGGDWSGNYQDYMHFSFTGN